MGVVVCVAGSCFGLGKHVDACVLSSCVCLFPCLVLGGRGEVGVPSRVGCAFSGPADAWLWLGLEVSLRSMGSFERLQTVILGRLWCGKHYKDGKRDGLYSDVF